MNTRSTPRLSHWSVIALTGAVILFLTAVVEFRGPSSGTLGTQLNYLYAAVLGAAFNGLFTAYSYLKNRTFDAQYVSIYWIRLLLGMIAGMILANVGVVALTPQGGPAPGGVPGTPAASNPLASLGPGIIALIGGYSVEAVRQVLDRLVEILVTTVRGKDAGASQQRTEFANQLVPLAADPSLPAAVRDQLQALIRRLQ